MSDIFFCYASEDRERIMPMVHALDSTGWSIFWDRVIPPGKTWRQVIGSEIKNCRCIIVVWSQKSVKSDWVQEEAEEAKRRQILVPVMIDKVTPPFGFGSIQAADFTEWNGSTASTVFVGLIQAIASFIGNPPSAPKEGNQEELEEWLRAAAEDQKRATEAAETRHVEERERALEANLEAERELRRKAEVRTRELEDQAKQESVQLQNLQEILPGNWQADITVTYGVALSATFRFNRSGNFEGQILNPMVGMTPVQGAWSASNNALTLQGQQIIAFIPTPYFTIIQFSVTQPHELRGISSAGEQVMFRKIG